MAQPAVTDAGDIRGGPPRMSVVIATAGRPELLRQSLPAVSASVSSVPGTDVVIVEQASGVAHQICADLGIDAVVVSDPGRGASRARNIGTARAAGDVVLFTDDDCVVPVAWVEDHRRAHATASIVASCGAVEGLSRAPTGDDPVVVSRTHADGAAPWHVGHGSNIAVRRSSLLAVGGWDERIGPGTRLPAGEDADLIVRLLRHGDIVSGVGDPVAHVDWRTADENVRNLRSYEFGAGVWIGKALRAERATARPFVRGRLHLLADRWRVARSRRDRVETVRGLVGFGVGLARGWALKEQRAMAERRPRQR